MAQVGQITQISGREWSVNNFMSALRGITLAEAATLNYIGVWVRESTTANTNNLIGAIMSSSGLLLHQTNLITTPVANTAFVGTPQQIAFAGGLTVPAGNYILGVASNADPANSIIVQGANDTAGLPTWASDNENVDFYPTWPSDVSTVIHTDAARQWGMFLDYTAGASAPTITSLTPASPVRVAQTGVVIAGTNFGSTQGTGRVVISPSNDVNDVNAVNQTVTSWGASSITINVVRNTLAVATNLYMFVVNDGGTANASGTVVQILPSIGALLFGAGLLRQN